MLNISYCAVALPIVLERAMGTVSHIHMQIVRKVSISVCCVDKPGTRTTSFALSLARYISLSSFDQYELFASKMKPFAWACYKHRILRVIF